MEQNKMDFKMRSSMRKKSKRNDTKDNASAVWPVFQVQQLMGPSKLISIHDWAFVFLCGGCCEL